jgi:hypothetical protein|tara:strand:+ start:316 stop:543 length:228 start_codon:yes stop_codon:yes gene_type:complete
MKKKIVKEVLKETDIRKAIDHLTQSSYNAQRRRSPQIPAKDWSLIYGKKEQPLLEQGFQEAKRLESKKFKRKEIK